MSDGARRERGALAGMWATPPTRQFTNSHFSLSDVVTTIPRKRENISHGPVMSVPSHRYLATEV